MQPETISERRREVRVEQGPSTYTWTVTETVTHSRTVAPSTGQCRPPTPPHGLAAGPAPFQADDDILRSPFYASHTVDDSVDLGHRAPLLYPRPLPAEDGHYVYDPALQRAAVCSRQYNLSPHPRIVPGPPSTIFVPVAEENDRGPMRAGTPWHSPPRHSPPSPSPSSPPRPSIAFAHPPDDWHIEALGHLQSFSPHSDQPFVPPSEWAPYPEMPSLSEDRQSHCQPGYGALTDSGYQFYQSYQSHQPSVSLDSGYRTASAGEDTSDPHSASTSTSQWVPLDGAGYSDPALPRPRPGSPAVVCLSTGEVLSSFLPPPSGGYMPEPCRSGTPTRLRLDWGRRDEQWPWPEVTSSARQEYGDVLECGMGAESTAWTHGCAGRSRMY
ncbi:hypothetical protein K466DRAFT_400656 [Polyporus arcularius HHB13444]|uniref:Uncharacterized protein n=1 Tax=Polyporus arcularius HHB13444 TaxID=1314778 RepID=A0A5C3PVP3_9APHY|nr:hypothetical protein K466DRAFT_400656 [Polyporus arcularius HHB13444]